MRWALILVTCIAVAGCGSGPRSAEETARQWVEAVNAEDWTRACELSVTDSRDECVEVTRGALRDAQGEMRIEGFHRGGEKTTFAVTTPPAEGWTAYGPAELAVERHAGEYLVHFEVAVIR